MKKITKFLQMMIIILLSSFMFISQANAQTTVLDEGFESGAIPIGWTQEYANGTVDWTFVTGGHSGNPAAAHSGTYNALFYGSSYTAYATKLVSSPMDVTTFGSINLNFWHCQADWGGDQDELHVYYKTSATGAWTELASYTAQITDWTEENINIPYESTTELYIAFEGVSGYGYGAGVDDVVVSGGAIPDLFVEIGTGTSTSNRNPICYPYYDYSWSSALYLQSEIGQSLYLNKLSWYFDHGSTIPYTVDNQKIYLKNVTESSYGSPYTYPDPENNGYTLVYEGSVTFDATGWFELPLDIPFFYDGVANLEMVWENYDGSGMSGYPYFRYTSKSNRNKYKYQNSSFPAISGYRNSYVANIRLHYYFPEEGTIAGTVTDNATSAVIAGATVTAGSDYTVTLADGTYSFDVMEGDYDLICSKAGYATQTLPVTVIGNDVLTQDFLLLADANAPGAVLAEVIQTDGEAVNLTWGLPGSTYEIIYDDGIGENNTCWVQEGNMNALKFTPAAYPCKVEGGSVNIGDGTYPENGDILQDFNMAVFDDDGTDGLPGTSLGQITVTPIAAGWVVFNFDTDISIADGNFYLVMTQGGNYPDCAPIAIDETNPVMRSYSKFVTGGIAWGPAGYNDFMMRAVVSGPGIVQPLDNSNPDFIAESRISVGSLFQYSPRTSSGEVKEGKFVPGKDGNASKDLLGFDVYRLMEDQEGDESAWTLLTSTTNTQYRDDGWEALAPGGYLWAVKANYSNSIQSTPVFSNLLGHNWESEITINVSLSTGGSPEGGSISFVNQDGKPEHAYSASVPADGIVVLPAVWNGTYDMDVALFGYDPYSQTDISVMDDLTINVNLMETRTPPLALSVDPLTSVATWLAPGVSLDFLDETWDSGSFTNNEWTFDPSQGNWGIYTSSGNPTPCARFYWSPSATNYSNALVSKEFSGMGIPAVKLDFDAYLSGYSTSTNENLDVEVFDGSTWNVVKHLDNQGGSISWTTYTVDITAYTAGDFKVRFRANGANTFNINYWYVDNIKIYGETSSKDVLSYHVAIDGALAGITSDLTFTYQDLLWGQTYTASVAAIYGSGPSVAITYIFQSAYLPPPCNLAIDADHHDVHFSWSAPGAPPTIKSDIVFPEPTNKYYVKSDAAPSFGPAPKTAYIASNEPKISTPKGSIGYADDVENNNFYYIDTDNPSSPVTIGSASYQAFAGCFMLAPEMYTIDYTDNYLKTIDINTGIATTIASCPCPMAGSGGIWSEIACNKNTNVLYGVATDVAASELYIINPTDGTSTLVGDMGIAGAISCTIDANGIMYVFDIVSDNTFSVNLATGSSTLLGAAGIDGNYAQGMGYDWVNDVVYLAAYSTSAQLRILDRATGSTSLVASLPGETGAFDFPGGGGGNAPESLIAYNIYRSSNTPDAMEYIGQVGDSINEYYDNVIAGTWYYTVTAVYDDPTPGESMQPAPVDIYIYGEGALGGTVSEFGNAFTPIIGADITGINEVTGETFYSTSGAGGSYTVNVTEGTYTVACHAEGYLNDSIFGVFVPDMGAGTADFNLYEIPYPALGVVAERNYEHTQVDISWHSPDQFYIIQYDDGVAENVTAWDLTGNMNAVRFTPASYPCEILAGQINIYDGSWPGGNILTPFQVMIMDDDGENGMPGTQLGDAIDVTPTEFGWVDFTLPGSVTIPDGDFYIVMVQGGDYPDCAPIAIDETNPVYRSYSKYVTGGRVWEAAGYADFMMRAQVYNAGYKSTISYNNEIQEVAPIENALSLNPTNVTPGTYKVGVRDFVKGDDAKDLEHYEVYRLTKGNEGHSDTWVLLDDNVNGTSSVDTEWPNLPKAYYKYAVKAIYSYNQSGAVFSNAIPQGYDSEITVNVTTNNNNSAEGAYVIFTNLDGDPEHVYDGTVAAGDSIVFFHELWNGQYDLVVTKAGYFPFELTGLWITGDQTFNVELEEQYLPPINFKVNNQTGVATWLTPVVDFETVFEEDFEGGSIPSGWTQEYIVQSVSWTVQEGGAGMTAAHSGTNNACFTGSSAKTKLVTPELDLHNAIVPTLSFWHAQVAGFSGVDDLKVFYKRSKNDNWKIISTYSAPAALWKYETLELPDVTANYYLAFEGFAPESGGGAGICLDDVKIEVGVDQGKAKDLMGYELFLDGTYIDITTDLTLDYTDYVTLIVGQTYIASIRAKYDGGNSLKVQYPFTYYPCENLNSPQNIQDSVSYNNVYLTWEAPAIEMQVLSISQRENTINSNLDLSPKHRVIAGGVKKTWDLQFNFPCADASGEAGVETDGSFIYSALWNGTDFCKYDLSGNYIENITIPGASGVRDLAYDGQYFYGGAAATSIFQMDFDNLELVGTISSPVAVRAIAYDDNNDGFWVNNWSTDLTLVGRDGSLISSFACGSWASYYGLAYDTVSEGGPFLWGFSQDGSGGVIVQMNPESGVETGITHDVAAELGISGGSAGGLFVQENMVPTSTTIGGLMQNDKIFGYELVAEEGAANGPLGYNVYRDGDKRNSDLLTGLEFNEYVTPGGIYYYSVVAVYEMGESCHDEFPVHISESLDPPTNLTGEKEGENTVNLAWNVPSGAGDQILWDQIDPQGETYGSSAQDFEADYDVYDAEIAGDFSLAEAATINSAKFVFFYANASTESFPFNVSVYANEGGQPAATAIATSQTSACPPDANNVFAVSLVDPITLDAGTYWLGFQIKMDVATSVAAQGYASQRTTLDMTTPAYWRNPGDGFGTGFTTWAQNVTNANGDQRDVCFQIIGTIVDGKSLTDLMSKNKVIDHTIVGTSTLAGLNINAVNQNTIADYSNYTNDTKALLYGYNIYRDGKVIDYVSEPDTTFTQQPEMLKLYTYAVSAVYGEGESAVAGPVEVDLTPVLIAPINLLASVECFDVTLTWDTLAGQGEGNFLGYNLYRNGELIVEELTDLSFVDAGLVSGSYEYAVVSVYDVYGESDPAGPISVVIGTYDAPLNLEKAVGNNLVVLTWVSPVAEDAWLHYDSGINEGNAIGTNDVFDFDVAARYEGSQLTQYNGMTLTKISFFPNEADCEYSLRVWTGANAATMLLDQVLTDVVIGEWNEVMLTTPVTVDASDELWFGYRANAQTGYPAGCDAGPAVAGYGDMIYDAESGWASMSVAYGLDYNWNIQGFVTSAKGETISLSAIQDVDRTANEGSLSVEKSDSKSAKTFDAKALVGYNVYRDGGQINENVVIETTYTDVPAADGIYTYYVTAVYDACESVPSNEVTADFRVGINEESGMVSIYPNPATEVLNIKVSNDVKEIKVYNYVGQLVYATNVTSTKTIQMNTTEYNAGTYLMQFTTEDGKTITKKVVIIK